MCKICERTFDSFHGLKQHMSKAHSIIYYADVQGKEDSPRPVSNYSSMEYRDDSVSEGDSSIVNGGVDPIRPSVDTEERDPHGSPQSLVLASPNRETGHSHIVCSWCDARFFTFTAVRVHDRQQHPEIFATGNEQHPAALFLENQLEDMASYELQNGHNVRTMARDLCLTEEQVRPKRGICIH